MAMYVRVQDSNLDTIEDTTSVLIKVQELKEMRARENKIVSLIGELKGAVARVEGKADKANTMLSTFNNVSIKLDRFDAEERNGNVNDEDRHSDLSGQTAQKQRSSSSSSSHTSTECGAGHMSEQPSTSAAPIDYLSVPLPRMSPQKRRSERYSDEDSDSDNENQCLPMKRSEKYVDVDDSDDDTDTPPMPNIGKKRSAALRSNQSTPPLPEPKRPQRMPPVDYTQHLVNPGDILDTPVVSAPVARNKPSNSERSAGATTPKLTNSINKSRSNRGDADRNANNVSRGAKRKINARDEDSADVQTSCASPSETSKRQKLPSPGDPVKHQMFVSDGAVVWWDKLPKGGLKLRKQKYRKKMHDFIASSGFPGTSVEDLCANPADPSDQFKDVFSSLLSHTAYEEFGIVNTGGKIYMKGNYNLNDDDRTMAEFIHDLPQPMASAVKMCCELMFSADVPEVKQFAVVRNAIEDLKDTIPCHPGHQ